MRFTERDPSLKHQVQLLVPNRAKNTSQVIHVSCNCLKAGKTLGPVHDFRDTLRIYNEHLNPEELEEWGLRVQRRSP